MAELTSQDFSDFINDGEERVDPYAHQELIPQPAVEDQAKQPLSFSEALQEVTEEEMALGEVAEPSRGQDAFTDALNQITKENLELQNQQAEYWVEQALKMNPEKYASIKKLSAASNLPEDIVEKNFEAVRDHVAVKDLMQKLEFSPFMKAQLTRPEVAKAAAADAESLGLLERTGRQAASGFLGDAYALAMRGYGAGVEAIGRVLPDVVGAPIARGGKMWKDEFSRTQKWVKENIAVPEGQQGFYDHLVAGLGQVGGILLTGGTVAPAVVAAQGSGVIDERMEGKDVGDFTRLAALAGGAGASAITAKVPLDILFGKLSVPIVNQTGRYAANVAAAGGAGFVMNAIEAMAHDQVVRSLVDSTQRIETADALYAGLVGGSTDAILKAAIEGMVLARARNIRKDFAAQEGQSQGEAIRKITELSKNIKMSEHSPSEFEQLIEEMSESIGIENVYIEADALFQSGHAEALAEAVPELREAIERSEASNTPLAIPLAQYTSTVAKQDFIDDLVPHFKTDPAGMSKAESDQYYAEGRQEELEQEFAEIRAKAEDQQLFEEGVEKLRDQIASQLESVGLHSKDQASAQAHILARVLAVRADAQGKSLDEYVAERLPAIARGEAAMPDAYAQQVNTEAEQIRQQYEGTEQYMKAPNGEQSALNETQWAQVRTPAFKEWFGDWENDPENASKVVDENGEPLVVYHGTPDFGFSVFDKERMQQRDRGDFGAGFYFTPKKGYATSYTEHGYWPDGKDESKVYGVFVSMKNPLVKSTRDMNDIHPTELEEVDGVIAKLSPYDTYREDGYWEVSEVVSFEPTQIKSATDNIGAFDPTDPNIYHQLEEQNLFVGHNLTAENILAAHELGGLAAPSLAIGRADKGFEGYGEITLLADPSLLEDKKIHTFDADIYSPRQPRAEFNLNEKAYAELEAKLDPEDMDLGVLSPSDAVRLENLRHRDSVKELYLREVGDLPKIRARKIDPAYKGVAALGLDSFQSLMESSELPKLAKRHYAKKIKENEGHIKTIRESGKEVPAFFLDRVEGMRERYFDESGSVRNEVLREFAEDALREIRKGERDSFRYAQDIEKKIMLKKHRAKYDEWVENLHKEITQDPYVFAGFTPSGSRKHIPYNLDNVVKEMTRQLKSGENFFYGAGNVRAQYANEMRTLDQIKARRDQIITADDMATIQEESSAVLDDTIEKLKPFYKFDADGYSAQKDMMQALAEGKKGISEAFNITPESQEIIDNLVGYLANLPTAYFEAKAQRAVDFGEFKTAVVPKGSNQDALKVLRDAGVKIKYYDPKEEGARQKLLEQQSDLLFQQPQGDPLGAYSPSINTIALFDNANLSTFLHEVGHFVLENDIHIAKELIDKAHKQGYESLTHGEQTVLADVTKLMDWFGISGQGLEQQLANWDMLGQEERRVYHEQMAESFEHYLFEGKAPSVELQPTFNRIRNMMVAVYRSIKDFLTKNPAAGKLNDEVREVFDRMLATEDQIMLAQQGQSMMPLFRTQEEVENIGMTPEEFEEYLALDQEATSEAIQNLEGRALRDMRWISNAKNKELKRLRRESKALRSEIEMEVRREVMGLPVYQAWQFLKGKRKDWEKIKTSIDKKYKGEYHYETEPIQTAIARAGGLNRTELEADGLDPKDKLESGVFGKFVFRTGDKGLGMDEMAELLSDLGYVAKDEHGRADITDLRDKLDAALSGESVYSIYANWQLILEGRKAGESFDLTQLDSGRLDLDSLRGMEDISVEEIESLKKLRMTSGEGIHPDLVAVLFGYRDGTEMIQDLLSFESPQKAIKEIASQRMLSEHGELATEDALSRAADDAIHNEARAKVIATESNALARAAGTMKVLRDAAKQYAFEMVSRTKVKDISPHKFSLAEARAGRNAAKAVKEGDLAQASAEKRVQLINNMAVREARNARDEVQKIVNYLSSFNRAGVRKKLDVEYIDQIDTILEEYDLRPSVSAAALARRESLAEWVQKQEDQGHNVDLPQKLLDEVGKKHYKDLELAQLRALSEAIKQIDHIGRLKNKLITAKRERDLDALAKEVGQNIAESVGGKTVSNQVRETVWDKTLSKLKNLVAIHRKVAGIARQADGWKDGGPLWEALVMPMHNAANKELEMRSEARKVLGELAEPILKQGRMGGKGVYFDSVGRYLNRTEKMAILLNWGNESNRQRLLDGYEWTVDQIMPVLETMTRAELEFAQGVWNYFETFRPEISRIEKQMNGREPEWIDPDSFTVRLEDGSEVTLEGGYYPVKYDPRQSAKAQSHEDALQADALRKAAFTASTTNHSFTKTRAERVIGRPLMLSMDGVWQGFGEVIRDIAWREWLFDANRIVNKIDKPMRDHFGADTIRQLQTATKDIAQGEVGADGFFEETLVRVRNGATITGLGWSVMTMIMQLTGVTQTAVRIGHRSLLTGMREFYGSPLEMRSKMIEVQEKSTFMRDRSRTINRDISEIRNRFDKRGGKFREFVESSYFIGIVKIQALVDYPTWFGAYEKASQDPINWNKDGTLNEEKVIALADQAVKDTQGSGLMSDLSKVERGGPLSKLFTNFYNYFNTTFNLSYEVYKRTNWRDPKDAAAGVMDYLMLYALPAMFTAVVKLAVQGEDDPEEYLKRMAAETVAMPLATTVYTRDIAGAAQNALGLGQGFDYSGPTGLRFFGALEALGKTVSADEIDRMRLYKNLNTVTGIWFNYPAGALNRFVEGMDALIEGDTDNPLSPLFGVPPKDR